MRFSQVVIALGMASVVNAMGCNKTEQQQQAPQTMPQGQQGDSYLVLNDAVLTLTPSMAESVPHPQGGAAVQVSNVIGHLFRGVRGVVGPSQGAYTWIKLVDDAEGWILTSNIAPTKGLTEATVVESTPVFRNPAEIQSQFAGVVAPGELIYIIEASKPMSKVQVQDVGVVYIDARTLVQDDTEVEMAHLIIHSKMYARAGDYGEISETLDEARIEHPNSQLISVIADMVDMRNYHEVPAMPTSRINERPEY